MAMFIRFTYLYSAVSVILLTVVDILDQKKIDRPVGFGSDELLGYYCYYIV
jgi:hypothetical protein